MTWRCRAGVGHTSCLYVVRWVGDVTGPMMSQGLMMNSLAEKLYRAFAFGEELDDDWGEEVLATAQVRRVSVEQVIAEAAQEAEARVRRESLGEADAQLPKAA